MRIDRLAESVAGATLVGDPRTEITALAYHTRDVGDGTLFLCVRGFSHDGHDHAAEAVHRGAVALVCERRLPEAVPQLLVSSTRAAMPRLAARFYDDPSRRLDVVGVTGTNGKTTTAHLLATMFEACGRRSGVLGTVSNRVGGEDEPVVLTTPESLDLQALLARMVAAGDEACVMEVSSHALALGRTAGVRYAAVVFTNLSRDHLDFHPDFEAYYAAKRKLFLSDGVAPPGTLAVVNVSGEWGRRLASECRAPYGERLWTCAVEDGAGVSGAGTTDVRAVDVELGADGTAFTLVAPRVGLDRRVELRLAARFNVENALVAATTALALGLPADDALCGLSAAEGVPGRFEAVRAGQPFAVLVDYSHTPDSLENALHAARSIAAGRLLVVFGCGGDRDRGKRPLMGGIAARLADRTYVTSDNPRSEDPEAIITEILAGVPQDRRGTTAVEPDRRRAIELAVAEARAGDVVLIAGKGHEQGQTFAARKLPFDDRLVAAEALRHLGHTGASAGVGRTPGADAGRAGEAAESGREGA
ncbi:MAG TPA: UDP-N-acetylmuramoyl-L-alanyl-D-glutamate--2,6-diaminopimelate ligase [Thermoleophilia bacterium]|nr:UDP-N-acetylmuramoyl-L-alanyl-D-glutamate--2,6-diaminopimelate ligase [Thermoleophilia bacterium]